LRHLTLRRTKRNQREASPVSAREKIESEIRNRGPVPFSRYMDICLYDSACGYYSTHAEQFGKTGAFYTSSDIHAVFGRLLARQFEEMWRALDRPPQIEILELGPGRGLFARDVLDWSKKRFPDFFTTLTYTLQEGSPALRVKLQNSLADHIRDGKARVTGESPSATQSEPTSPFVTRTLGPEIPLIVFANEFFDALPVEILSPLGKLHLALEDNRLHEIWLPPRSEELEFLDHYGVHPEARERIEERIEVPILAQSWMRQLAHAIQRGMLVVIDYGYTRNEQLAGRHRGTLMAYRRHSASPDPYQAPGEQDLTAHVNFTALAAAGEQDGMRCEKLRTQTQFLMGIGEKNQFGDAFEECRLPQERAKVALQLKHLVSPEAMGETFQVFIASRGIDAEKVSSLSGLAFGS
jgi:SAM-dependent MidA family methyltransferase